MSVVTTEASDDSSLLPVRHADFVIDLHDSPASLPLTLSLPCVGFDFGSHFLRSAVVRRVELERKEAVVISVATFVATSEATRVALADAKKLLAVAVAATSQPDAVGAGVKVHYTGHATAERVKQLEEAFPQASVTRRDKLDCLNKSVHFLLISKLRSGELFHDTTALEKARSERLKRFQLLRRVMPRKAQEFIQYNVRCIQARGDNIFPLTLSIIGSNNIACKLKPDGHYDLVDARCVAAVSMEKMWQMMKTPESPGGMNNFLELAALGDRRKVDGLTSEVGDEIGYYSLWPENYPLFDFAKMEHLSRYNVAPQDLARALCALHLDMILCKTTDFAMTLKAHQVYYTGSLIQHDFIREELLLRGNFYFISEMPVPKFFKTDALAAIGACLA